MCGTIVTQDKVCLWLEKDILLRRKRAPAKQTKDGDGSGNDGPVEIDEDAKNWAQEKGMQMHELEELFRSDHFTVSDHASGEAAFEQESDQPGALLGWSSIEKHLSAVASLHSFQQAMDPALPPFRGAALKALVDSRRKQKDAIARESYADRGEGGVDAAYSTAEWLRMQEILLKTSVNRPQVSRLSQSIGNHMHKLSSRRWRVIDRSSCHYVLIVLRQTRIEGTRHLWQQPPINPNIRTATPHKCMFVRLMVVCLIELSHQMRPPVWSLLCASWRVSSHVRAGRFVPA